MIKRRAIILFLLAGAVVISAFATAAQSNVAEYYIIKLSPDGQTVAGTAYNRNTVEFRLRLWDAQTGETLTDLVGNSAPILDIAWSPESNRLVGSDGDFNVIVWCTDRTNTMCDLGEEITRLSGYTSAVNRLDWNENDILVAASRYDLFSIRTWDMTTYTELNRLNAGEISDVAWSPDGSQIAASGHYEGVYIYDSDLSASPLDLSSYNIIAESEIPALSLAWDNTGSRLAYGQEDGDVVVVDPVTHQELGRLEQHDRPIYALAWSPDNNQLATASSIGAVIVWNPTTDTYQTVSTVEKQTTATYGISWYPSGTLLYPDDSNWPVNLPTPIPTATFTPTDTLVNTVTHTATPTSTPTASNTPTATFTPTASFTPTSTPTNTPTATFTPTNEPVTWQNEIAFASNRTGGYNLYRAVHDASTAVQLTTHGGSNSPVWSPSREWIVYVKDADLWVLHVASLTTQAITALNTSSEEFSPTWSPDGDQIAFSSDRDGDSDIYVADLTLTYNGGSSITVSAGTATNITTNSAFDDRLPVWSPVANSSATNYNRIAFRTNRGAGGNNEIYTILADGTDLTAVTSTAAGVNNTQPEWAPSGFWMAFASNLNGSNLDIYAVQYSGGEWLNNWRRFTNTANVDENILAWRGFGEGLWLLAYTRIPASGNRDIRILEIEKLTGEPPTVVGTFIPDWNSTDDDTSPDW